MSTLNKQLQERIGGIEQAIRFAIDEGYKARWDNEERLPYLYDEKYNIDRILDKKKIILDPLFWQALGKQQGWDEYDPTYSIEEHQTTWFAYWHTFIDHIAEGKSIDEFFNNLIK